VKHLRLLWLTFDIVHYLLFISLTLSLVTQTRERERERERENVRLIDTHRCPGPKCGKWRGAACAVRKAARERLVFPCSVHERNQERRNSGRWDHPRAAALGRGSAGGGANVSWAVNRIPWTWTRSSAVPSLSHRSHADRIRSKIVWHEFRAAILFSCAADRGFLILSRDS